MQTCQHLADHHITSTPENRNVAITRITGYGFTTTPNRFTNVENGIRKRYHFHLRL